MTISKITDSVIYVGVNDHDVDLFEGQYVVENGMSYNSYVILDEKVAVMDTVSKDFEDEWLGNIEEALDGRMPDYLVVHHMEPDHSANIDTFVAKYPKAQIVANVQIFQMMAKYFGTDYSDQQVVVKEGVSLDLGQRKLHFVSAPFVHWPEVMVSYDDKDKILFSADGFGKFGANDVEDPEGWACEAARYYIGIVGMYGDFVQKLLAKASGLDISVICPLHGPVLTENLGYYIDLYDKWSSYTPERDEVTIAYTSVYGNTKAAALLLAEELENRGVEVAVFDLARDDMAEAVEDAFRNNRLVLATTTYNNGIFPFMHTFINSLVEHNFQKRTVAFIENGTWNPKATMLMRKMLSGCDNLEFVDNNVRINAALDDESRNAIAALADELAGIGNVEELEVSEKPTGYKVYQCRLCRWIYDEEKGWPDKGIEPGTRFADLPEDFACPLCGVGVERFDALD